MAEKRTTPAVNKNTPLRCLSSTKRRRGSSNSIASLFRNAPPAKLACPVCGEMVPRFWINDHIDTQCQSFQRDNTGLDSSHAKPCVLSPPCDLKSTMSLCTEVKKPCTASPYFKKHNLSQSDESLNGEPKVIGTVDLGRLASKLSRKSLKFLHGIEMPPSVASAQIHVSLQTAAEDSYSANPQAIQHGDPAATNALSFQRTATPDNTDQVHREEQAKSEEPQYELHLLASPASQRLATSSPQRKRKAGEASSRVQPTPTPRDAANAHGKSGRCEEVSRKKRHAGSGARDGIDDTYAGTGLGGTSPPVSLDNDGLLRLQEVVGAPNHVQHMRASADVVQGLLEPQKLPYYLRNFLIVLGAVLDDQDDRLLFSQEDLDHIHAFHQLSVAGQMLYVRLFQRKLHWLRISKLDYSEIASNLTPIIHELATCGLLEREDKLLDLEEVLDLVPAPELRGLAKTFHLGNPGAQKQELVVGLLRLSRQRSVFAGGGAGAGILKRSKQLVGECVQVSRDPRAVFSRVLLLFSLTDSLDEENTLSGAQGQLYTALLMNSGRLAFPTYNIFRRAKVFLDREELIRYEAAMQVLQEVTVAMQVGSWVEALKLYLKAKATWQEQQDTCNLSHQEALPWFLRRFTAGWAYTRILSRGVEILQRLRRYEEAVEELQSLLAQLVYCPDSRGRWWDRLALNLQQHLKRTEQAINAIRDGLSDPLVRTGHRLSLSQRGARMRDLASCRKFNLLLGDLLPVPVRDITHVTIRGLLFPHSGSVGKSVFLMPADQEGGAGEQDSHATVMCSVEELALAHYRRLGFDQGIHGEGSTFSTLFGLLFWDIIFMGGIPDVFRNPYQTCPLDLHTDCFYESRQGVIERRLQALREASLEMLQGFLAEVWNSQEGKVCALVSWERFSSLQQAQGLVSCLGGVFLAGLLQRMAKDYRHCRGGLPDLVVWNPRDHTYKLVEVKGPNDRLSHKQQIWLDELHRLGADVEVCHVTDVGARGGRD